MMLVLALSSDADHVYERALQFFTPEEIAEAFAATYGMASPSQLRGSLKQDGRDLVGRFRELAPERPRISIQRWSLRRLRPRSLHPSSLRLSRGHQFAS